MRILGLKVWPEKPTDAEYVERIRKLVRSWRWMRYFCTAMSISWLVLLVLMISQAARVVGMIHRLARIGQEELVATWELVSAVFIGIIIGGLLCAALFLFMDGTLGHRKNKLLLDCWDALHPNKDAPQ